MRHMKLYALYEEEHMYYAFIIDYLSLTTTTTTTTGGEGRRGEGRGVLWVRLDGLGLGWCGLGWGG